MVKLVFSMAFWGLLNCTLKMYIQSLTVGIFTGGNDDPSLDFGWRKHGISLHIQHENKKQHRGTDRFLGNAKLLADCI